MSKGYWSGIFAFGLVAGGGIAIFLMIWVIGLNYCPNAPCYYSSDGDQQPQNNEYWVPFATGPDTTSSFGPEDREGNPKYYDRQDLRAQETMARATNAIVWVSGISIILGVIGAAAIIWTLLETRVLARNTREIGEAQVRAYLGFEVIGGEVAIGNPVVFKLRVTNHGSSPALNLGAVDSVVMRPKGWRWDEDSESPNEDRPKHYLHPGGSFELDAEMNNPQRIMLDAMREKALRDDRACLFGSVTVFFEDVFAKKGDTPRIAQFRFEFSGERCFTTNVPRMASDGNYST